MEKYQYKEDLKGYKPTYEIEKLEEVKKFL